MTTTHPIEVGALARVKEDTALGEYKLRAGREFIVEDYVNEVDSEDGVPFYWGSSFKTGNMNDVVVVADVVELVKSRAQMEARTLPDVKAVAEFLASEALSGNDKFDFSEADYGSQDGSLELLGRTDDGLPFVADIKVIRVVQVDE